MRMRARIPGGAGTRRRLRSGVTLLELLVVLVVLAMAAAAATAAYTKTLEHARAETAINALRAIRAREEARHSITGAYYSGAALVGAAAINPPPAGTGLRLNLTDGDYICTLTGNGAAFTATANPSAARAYAGTMTMNQAGAWSGSSPFVPNAQE